MSEDERLARLERRLETLEGLVRQLLAARASGAPGPATTAPAGAAQPEPAPATTPGIQSSWPTLDAAPLGSAREAVRAIPPRTVPPPRSPTRIISEQWLGQRGLLAVGVVFVVLAAGYLLKLSFDRGWISPLVRCVGGVVVGLGIGALGWRLHGRGTRTYGAALVGCGAAVVYLAVWAAARLYEFLPVTPAIGALALVSLGLAGVALAIDVEALGATAALGAFLAPIVIGKEAGSVNLLLIYLGAMGAALGAVAARRHWRVATAVVALAYFGVASSGILSRAQPGALYLYGILGGAAGLYVGLRERWLETRFLSFGGGWTVLAIANGTTDSHWPTLLGGIVLTAPVWWRALTAGTVWPATTREGLPAPIAFGDSLYFYLSAPLLGFALQQVSPSTFRETPGLLYLLVALPYLAVGLSRADRQAFSVVAAIALAGGALVQWSGVESTWALLAVVHLWALSDHWLRRTNGGHYALGTLAVALWHLLFVDFPARPALEAAFSGARALGLWLAIETCVVLAMGLLRDPEGIPRFGIRARPLLWALAGLLLLFGVTVELMRAFDQSSLEPTTAHLAGGLSVSAWWILCAAACFVVGFRRAIRPLRLSGFGVAGLALLKVVFIDLSELDALYRVGSAFILGVASLAIAYAYHRTGERA